MPPTIVSEKHNSGDSFRHDGQPDDDSDSALAATLSFLGEKRDAPIKTWP